MTVKCVIKKKEDQKLEKKNPANQFPVIRVTGQRTTITRENIIIRIIRIMVMDVRLRLNRNLREKYEDYSQFCNLARGKR